jgi:hypothetical protein
MEYVLLVIALITVIIPNVIQNWLNDHSKTTLWITIFMSIILIIGWIYIHDKNKPDSSRKQNYIPYPSDYYSQFDYKGVPVSGTVYADDPNNTPGLGWIK